ncbi:hypothetical protein MMC19_002436 [Ptychographa xylographoides]|nr:hypothetical protein [Ptychographa xylographoides]
MAKQQFFLSTSTASACPHAPIVATIYRSHLLLRSSHDGTVLHSAQLDTHFVAGCTRLRWFHTKLRAPSVRLAPLRILLADDDTIHVYDVDDTQWHVVIKGASSSTGRVANVEFGHTQDEVIVFSDFGLKATVWSLLTSRGVEVRDPKLPSGGHCFRPNTGHLAILTRETAKDVVLMLKPGTRELEKSFTLGTVDAQGLEWSPDGRWLVTWEAASAGTAVFIYTADGHLYKTYHGGQDVDTPGLGVRTLEWDCHGRYLAVGDHNDRVTLLSATDFQSRAILHHNTTITSPHATIWQEQISTTSHERSYAATLQPACPPHSQSTTNTTSKNSLTHFPTTGISHLTFNRLGTLLASRSLSTPTTVWIWSLSADAVAPCATLIHHCPVRSLQWNAQDPESLLIHTASDDQAIHIWNPNWDMPRIVYVPLPKPAGRTEASWIYGSASPFDGEVLTIMLSNAQSYALRRVLVDGDDENGRDDERDTGREGEIGRMLGETEPTLLGPEDMFDEGNSMDLSPIKLSREGFGMGMRSEEEVDDTFDYRRHLIGAF